MNDPYSIELKAHVTSVFGIIYSEICIDHQQKFNFYISFYPIQ